MPDRLKNKVAVVFGAGSIGEGWGNGKATAVAYAREGARVIAADLSLAAARETATIITDEGGQCEAVEADVTQSDSILQTVNRCMALHDQIDILHNNVGVTFLGGPVELSEERWAQTMQINLGSLFLTTKHILPIMEAQGSGAIINVSSIASIRWIGTAYIGYAASKAAVNQFTQAIALQYAPQGIRANAILPGMMDTPTVRVSLQAEFADEAELIAKRNAACPTGKMGDAWDIAWASVFLASDEAKYITGVLLPVDGGMTCKSA